WLDATFDLIGVRSRFYTSAEFSTQDGDLGSDSKTSELNPKSCRSTSVFNEWHLTIRSALFTNHQYVAPRFLGYQQASMIPRLSTGIHGGHEKTYFRRNSAKLTALIAYGSNGLRGQRGEGLVGDIQHSSRSRVRRLADARAILLKGALMKLVLNALA